MDLSFVIQVIVDVLLLPLQVILIPIDALLSQIPGLSQVPLAIGNILSLIGSIPQTLVSLAGINPTLWNVFFLTFVLYLGAAPAINALKKIWAWLRP